MKVKVSAIVLGIVVLVVALYAYKVWTTPTVKVVMKKEGFETDQAKTIVGAVVGLGLIAFFIGATLYAGFSAKRSS